MRFYNVDLHISVIADMKSIFESLGHEVVDVSLSDHTWVLDKKKGSVPMLDNGNWMRLSCDEMSELFYKEYYDDLKDYDAFIVTYPPPFALLYKKFNKPIIVNIPIRYEWPLTFRPEEWSKFNQYLRDGVDSGQIVLVANNLTDKMYAEAYLNRPVRHIPSYCDYFPQKYTGVKDEFIYYSKGPIVELESISVKNKSDVLKNHSYEDLLSRKGIVHIPYACSYMSIFEQYAANMPLFVPDINLLMDLYSRNQAFSEILFSKMYNSDPRAIPQPDSGVFKPNNYGDLSVVRELASGSDFYDSEWMPDIQQFSSFEHLADLLKSCDTEAVSQSMNTHNVERKSRIMSLWKSIILSIS